MAITHAGDDSVSKVQRALREANIAPVLIVQRLGSAWISVPKQDQTRALSIIEADAKEHCYWVTLWHEVNPDLRDTLQ